jgi:hypothetical protein
MTTAILAVLGAGLATGCGSGSAPTGPAGDAVAGSAAQAQIVAVAPPVVSGCAFRQAFDISSPQVIDWLAAQTTHLSDVQLRLFQIDSFGQAAEVHLVASQADDWISSAVATWMQSVAVNRSDFLAFQSSASRFAGTTVRGVDQGMNSLSSTGSRTHVEEQTVHNHHDDATTLQNDSKWTRDHVDGTGVANVGTSASSGGSAQQAGSNATQAAQQTNAAQVGASGGQTAASSGDGVTSTTGSFLTTTPAAGGWQAANSSDTTTTTGMSQGDANGSTASQIAYDDLSQLGSTHLLLQATGTVTGDGAGIQLFEGAGGSVLAGSAFPLAASSCAP